MCFHCEQGNPQHHIPTESRRLWITGELHFRCYECGKDLTDDQARGKSPHRCEWTRSAQYTKSAARYIMIQQPVATILRDYSQPEPPLSDSQTDGCKFHSSPGPTPNTAPPQVTGGAPHGFGVMVDGKFVRVDVGHLGDIIVKLQNQVRDLQYKIKSLLEEV